MNRYYGSLYDTSLRPVHKTPLQTIYIPGIYTYLVLYSMYICTRYIPKTNTRYYSTLYNTSLKLVHKNTTINSTIRGGGGSPSSLFVAVSPVPQGSVRLFMVL